MMFNFNIIIVLVWICWMENEQIKYLDQHGSLHELVGGFLHRMNTFRIYLMSKLTWFCRCTVNRNCHKGNILFTNYALFWEWKSFKKYLHEKIGLAATKGLFFCAHSEIDVSKKIKFPVKKSDEKLEYYSI